MPGLCSRLAAGAAAVVAYVRLPAARTLLTVLGPAPVVFVVLFLVFSDVSDLVFPAAANVQATHVKATAPIVLVIFDEFPVHSLMAADGRVDAVRYPNFARLARGATWYRNTASVDQDTPYAVPAILDARLPRRERLPVAADHPRNIFSLLAGRYELHVREDATQLCAPRLCGSGVPASSLWGDLGRIYAHELLPGDVEDELPSVGEAWERLTEGPDTGDAIADTRLVPRESKRHRYLRLHANLAHDRPERFEEFVEGIEGGREPRLHLIHILLPHVPFQYLPSGHFYRRSPKEALPGIDGRPGYGIPFVVEQAYQRHLLQLEATDRLLGKLLDRLHEVGIYDRALVAVVADHGMSFRLGHDRRLVRPGNVQDIAPVPFFLKAPGQERGRISDKPLQTIDVLPTIMDELGVRIPWKVDGRSALLPARAHPHRMIIAKKFKHTYLVDTPSFETPQAAGAGAQGRAVRLRHGGHLSVRAPAGPDRAHRRRAGGRTVERGPARPASSRPTWPGRSPTGARAAAEGRRGSERPRRRYGRHVHTERQQRGAILGRRFRSARCGRAATGSRSPGRGRRLALAQPGLLLGLHLEAGHRPAQRVPQRPADEDRVGHRLRGGRSGSGCTPGSAPPAPRRSSRSSGRSAGRPAGPRRSASRTRRRPARSATFSVTRPRPAGIDSQITRPSAGQPGSTSTTPREPLDEGGPARQVRPQPQGRLRRERHLGLGARRPHRS